MTTPPDFVHLHVHSQYSILDGQASIQKLVDKAMRDGQPGIALTDHGNMFGIKEFYNYVKKVKGKYKAQAAEAEARLAALPEGERTALKAGLTDPMKASAENTCRAFGFYLSTIASLTGEAGDNYVSTAVKRLAGHE